MRKIILLFIVLFSFSISFAKNKSDGYTNFKKSNYGESYTFVERGITFSVFQNGEFDFYIAPRGQASANLNLGAVNISYNSGYNYDAYVQYDDYGAIVQIESLPIYYDYYGRVNRVGSIRIGYNTNRLVRIGNLNVYYNNYGYRTHYSGYINHYNRYYTYQPYHDYFVRPHYAQSIISHNPYRQYYSAERYYYKKNKKSHYNKRSFRKIESRVRVADSYNNRGRKYKDLKSTNDFSKRYSANRNSNKRVYSSYNRNTNTVSNRNKSNKLNRSISNRSQRTVANYKSQSKNDRTHGSKSRYNAKISKKSTDGYKRANRTVSQRDRVTGNRKYNNKASKGKKRTSSRSYTASRSH